MLHPQRYAEMLREKINKYKADVYLLNTGWSGGPFGIGERISIKYTRRMVKAAITGEFKNIEFVNEDFFNLSIPTKCPDIPSEIFNPINTWSDKEAYKKKAKELAGDFDKQIAKINLQL